MDLREELNVFGMVLEKLLQLNDFAIVAIVYLFYLAIV